MNYIKHDLVEARLGDDIEIAIAVLDREGKPVVVDDATATYRVAAEDSTTHIIEKTETDGIDLTDSLATVSFNTDELESAGDYVGQLRVTIDDKVSVVSEGKLKILPLIE